mgnify:CR=1 FL=1
MSKNLIPEFIKIIGVELSEEFKVVSKDGSEQICNFTMRGLFVNGNNYDKKLLAEILCGDAEIVKLPWKPKEGQTVYGFYARGISSVLEVISFVWVGSVVSHQALAKAGWVFKTRKEAEAVLPTVAKEMGAKYEL